MQYESQSSGASLSFAAVRLLSSRRTIEILNTIGKEARPVVEIANALGEDLGKVWRYVRKLEEAGILAINSKRLRGGRPQKLYEASAQEFVVEAVTRQQTVSRELSRALMESIERHDSSTAERFFFDGTRWRVEKIYPEGTPTRNKQHELWMVSHLDADQRDALRSEIHSLFRKYDSVRKPGSERFLVRFACAVYRQD